ncbi:MULTISPECIES: L-seryl-tRNA(Sec) selenium transferase [unclassified Modestobacter]|uniref:L-seryl-tRNA(Sec) selenium transferase n=1 Tax=unclassified Modestobacter TaxID=2643866 RepID=UPI0022AAC4CF|nr:MULTISPECIES: L-seryl-tRNA(Sec) selenium transferase [unclassified Modestobacter]MCZ2824557.1 L-seryl-tRNA(Sec) selenium transferase [Modestobacter sp. VKM Ac-2981]MCZ2853915.1 L-seryl-tRNA(Sec) selenium transferase [Modestobacter sp. VKM Ac-2982]
MTTDATTTAATTDPRRRVPRTDTVLADPAVAAAVQRLGRELVKGAVQVAQQRVRAGELPPDDVVAAVLAGLPGTASSLSPVLNATGVLVHTNLGRAPLSGAAVAAVVAASGTTDVELDLGTGRRGPRGEGALSALLAAVPAAEAALVVNNCAAALALVATAFGGELVIARGELVEIGDGFRIPDLLVSTGARLREVGTTNRVSLADYTDALGPDTGAVLKVHPSNFVVRGFTRSADVAELAPALAGTGVPLVADVGSGLLRPHPLLPDEPDLQTTLAAGADLVLCSGDKLLGGPQAGIVLGSAALVQRLRRHPLYRALRVDKTTLAALEATLRGPVPPVQEMLDADPAALQARATAVAATLQARGIEAVAVASTARVGGGGAPEFELPSAAVALDPRFAEPLRHGDPPVVGHLDGDRTLLDLRSLLPADDERLIAAVTEVARRWS